MNDKGVCRTIPAPPVQLNIREVQIRTQPIIRGTSFTLKKYQGGPDQDIAYYWGGNVSHLENIRSDQIRKQPIIGVGSLTLRKHQGGPDQNIAYYWRGGEDQFQMGQNSDNFLYSNFLGRTSKKNHHVLSTYCKRFSDSLCWI